MPYRVEIRQSGKLCVGVDVWRISIARRLSLSTTKKAVPAAWHGTISTRSPESTTRPYLRTSLLEAPKITSEDATQLRRKANALCGSTIKPLRPARDRSAPLPEVSNAGGTILLLLTEEYLQEKGPERPSLCTCLQQPEPAHEEDLFTARATRVALRYAMRRIARCDWTAREKRQIYFFTRNLILAPLSGAEAWPSHVK